MHPILSMRDIKDMEFASLKWQGNPTTSCWLPFQNKYNGFWTKYPAFYKEKSLFPLPASLFIAKTSWIFVSYQSLGFFPFIPFPSLFLYPSILPCFPTPPPIPSFPCLWFFPKRYHYNTCKIPASHKESHATSAVLLACCPSLQAPAAWKEFSESWGSPHLTIPSNHH